MHKKQLIPLIQAILFLVFANLFSVSAETIVLKSGKQIKGKIIERTERYIRVKTGQFSFPLTYYVDEIAQLEEEIPVMTEDITPQDSVERKETEKYLSETRQYLVNKEYKDALLALKKMIELNPNNADSYVGLGALYYKLGNFQDAISSFEKALSLRPNNSDVYLCLGIIYDSIGQAKEAKLNLSNALKLYREKMDAIKILVTETLLKKIN